MEKIYIMFIMFFLHFLADFPLQGILASMKQKEWWERQPNFNPMYSSDYLMALVIHSFSWGFMIMLPFLFSENVLKYLIFLFLNVLVHFIVDDLKANRHAISLCTDQWIHLLQIEITWIVFML